MIRGMFTLVKSSVILSSRLMVRTASFGASGRSLNRQRPDLPAATVEETREIVFGNDFRDRLQEFQFIVPTNIEDDVENLRPGISPRDQGREDRRSSNPLSDRPMKRRDRQREANQRRMFGVEDLQSEQLDAVRVQDANTVETAVRELQQAWLSSQGESRQQLRSFFLLFFFSQARRLLCRRGSSGHMESGG